MERKCDQTAPEKEGKMVLTFNPTQDSQMAALGRSSPEKANESSPEVLGFKRKDLRTRATTGRTREDPLLCDVSPSRRDKDCVALARGPGESLPQGQKGDGGAGGRGV